MWILVIGPAEAAAGEEGAAATLRQLGCTVEYAEFFDPMDRDEWRQAPPAAVLVEARDEVDAGRAALVRLRAISTLQEIPVLLSVTVSAIQRLRTEDDFDDFVLVPYLPAELYMRIRQAEWRRSDFRDSESVKMGEMRIDLAAHEVTLGGRGVSLTQQEFALLRFLCTHRGRVFSRQQLLERVWGVEHYGSSRTVDIHVRRLRMKLGRAIRELETVRGVGYKMRSP